jgi:LPXTG-site transpeptidase (sortase) family protein
VVRTRSERRPGRGGRPLTAAALGLALAVVGGVVSARGAAYTSGDAHGPVVSTGAGFQASPLSVEPAVRFEAADPPGPPRTPRPAPRAHEFRGAPERLIVPELGIDAPVVGIDAPGGTLVPPSDAQVLGWWRSGARPGARFGSALITGHTVSVGGGAFDDLETLSPGDSVRVRTAAGVIGYEVTGVSIYRKGRLARAAERLFSQDVPGRLVLVTCEDWNGSTYLSNAVVMAEPVR